MFWHSETEWIVWRNIFKFKFNPNRSKTCKLRKFGPQLLLGKQGWAAVNNLWWLHYQLTICLFSQHSQGAGEDNNVAMPIHIISQWSDKQNLIKWELEQKARAAWDATCCITHRQSSEVFCSGCWAALRGDLSVDINQMQGNTRGRPSADVKQKRMNAFHSWLGRIED